MRRPVAVHALLHSAGLRRYLFARPELHHRPRHARALSPSLTWIKGRHTWVFGGQLTETYDNYAQTNIASGAFAFNGSWTQTMLFPAEQAVFPLPISCWDMA